MLRSLKVFYLPITAEKDLTLKKLSKITVDFWGYQYVCSDTKAGVHNQITYIPRKLIPLYYNSFLPDLQICLTRCDNSLQVNVSGTLRKPVRIMITCFAALLSLLQIFLFVLYQKGKVFTIPILLPLLMAGSFCGVPVLLQNLSVQTFTRKFQEEILSSIIDIRS